MIQDEKTMNEIAKDMASDEEIKKRYKGLSAEERTDKMMSELDEAERFDMSRLIVIAIDLNTRRYPDCAANAILHLRHIERMRKNPGMENARQWGHGTHHVELRRLGLVSIGEPERLGGTHPVDLTTAGRIVADMVEGLRLNALKPVRCRCCGQLCEYEAENDLCEWCSTR